LKPSCPHCKRPVLALSGRCPGCGGDLGAAPAVDPNPFVHDLSLLDDIGPPLPWAAEDSLELDVPLRGEGSLAPVAAAPDLPARAAEVAGFGAAPQGLLACASYALHVRARKAELRREAARLAALHQGSGRAEVQALAALATAARAAGLVASSLDEAAWVAEAAESRVAEESRALEAVSADHAKRLGEIERARDAATEDVPGLQAEEAERARALADRSEKAKRALARAKRVEIEIRSRRTLATEHRAKGRAAEADRLEAEISTFEREQAERTAQARAETEAVEALERELAALRRRIAEGLGKGSLALDERARAEEAFRRHEGEQARRVDESASEAEEKLAEVGRKVLGARGDEPALADAVGAVRAATLARELLEREIDVLRAATELADAQAVRTGWMVLGGAVVLAVGAIAAGWILI
jgi:hypothetical protein